VECLGSHGSDAAINRYNGYANPLITLLFAASQGRSDMNTIAIVPARGGSKGIPHKNIVALAGKPLISYTIDAARKSKKVTRVVVSTEDTRIARVSRELGAEVVIRPKELASDNWPIIDTVIHDLSLLGHVGASDLIALLQPTSPLRSAGDIDGSIDLILEKRCDSVISVSEVTAPPFWTLKLERGYLKPILGLQLYKKRRQDLPTTYIPNGAVYVSTWKCIKRYRDFLTPRTLPFLMPKDRSVDIDNLADLELAERILKRKQ